MATNRLTAEQIEELERLEKAATPGPWQAWRHPHSPPELRGPDGEPPVAHWLGFDDCDRPKGGHMLNVALIAALRNAAPALLAAARANAALRRECKAWRDAKDDHTLELCPGDYGTSPTRQTREEFEVVLRACDETDRLGALEGE